MDQFVTRTKQRKKRKRSKEKRKIQLSVSIWLAKKARTRSSTKSRVGGPIKLPLQYEKIFLYNQAIKHIEPINCKLNV